LFQKARRKAWASIKQQSDILELIKEQQKRDYAQIQKRRQTANILNIPK